VTASQAAGSERFLAQSIAWEAQGDGARAKSYLESAVLEIDGVVLRYGRFYGPGTYYETALPEHPRIHLDEAAQRTRLALDAPSGIIVVDEESASD
jgi:hypothetical protein